MVNQIVNNGLGSLPRNIPDWMILDTCVSDDFPLITIFFCKSLII